MLRHASSTRDRQVGIRKIRLKATVPITAKRNSDKWNWLSYPIPVVGQLLIDATFLKRSEMIETVKDLDSSIVFVSGDEGAVS